MLLSFVKGTSISICTVLFLKMKIISNLDENHQYRALRHFNPRYVTTHDLSHAAARRPNVSIISEREEVRSHRVFSTTNLGCQKPLMKGRVPKKRRGCAICCSCLAVIAMVGWGWGWGGRFAYQRLKSKDQRVIMRKLQGRYLHVCSLVKLIKRTFARKRGVCEKFGRNMHERDPIHLFDIFI